VQSPLLRVQMVEDYPNVDFDVTDNVGNAGAGGQGVASIHTTSFKDFLLKEELCRSIADCGFEHPSQVQQECLPKALIGQDVLCQAKSGMGKTAVFVLSILNQLGAEPGPVSGLIVCHTRELAYQIKNEFARFTKHMPGVNAEVIYGGQPLRDHIKLFKDSPPTIVVGTPGRLLDLVKRKTMKLENLKTFVIDECDKVLEKLGKSHSNEIFGSNCLPTKFFAPSFFQFSNFFFLRYAFRRTVDLQGHTSSETSNDVLGNDDGRYERYMQEVHAEPIRGDNRP